MRVNGMVPVEQIEVDLMGDGQPATILRGLDLRPVGAVWFAPTRVGTFQLQVRLTDACGRTAATGAARPVKVQ
jgi:hypothetical protein